MKFIPAPDYPTHAEIITPASDIRNMYRTGQGSLRFQGRIGVYNPIVQEGFLKLLFRERCHGVGVRRVHGL